MLQQLYMYTIYVYTVHHATITYLRCTRSLGSPSVKRFPFGMPIHENYAPRRLGPIQYVHYNANVTVLCTYYYICMQITFYAEGVNGSSEYYCINSRRSVCICWSGLLVCLIVGHLVLQRLTVWPAPKLKEGLLDNILSVE